jgi:hypothetical protein
MANLLSGDLSRINRHVVGYLSSGTVYNMAVDADGATPFYYSYIPTAAQGTILVNKLVLTMDIAGTGYTIAGASFGGGVALTTGIKIAVVNDTATFTTPLLNLTPHLGTFGPVNNAELIGCFDSVSVNQIGYILAAANNSLILQMVMDFSLQPIPIQYDGLNQGIYIRLNDDIDVGTALIRSMYAKIAGFMPKLI